MRKTDERVLRTLAPLTFTQTVPDASGSDSHWLVVKFPVPDAAGGYGVGGMGIDVTERYRLEQALQDHEARMHLAMEAAQMGHWSWNAADRRVSLSDTMGPLLGLKRGTQLPHYEDWIAVIHPQDRKPFLAALAKSFRSDIALHHDCRMLKPNGEVLWMLTRGRAAYDVDGRRAGLVGVTLDISPRKEAESKLQAYAVQVRQLLYRLVDAQEAERRNLASALHDLIGQNLTALNIGMDILKRELPADAGTRAAPRLESMDAIMAETVDAVRDVMAQLHSPVLEDYGLVSALHWYAERFQERTGLSTTIDALDPFPRLGRNVELALYRIAQEALVNAARHSGASGVVVRVAREANRIRLAVEDDGRGFSDPAGARSARRGGWGLPEMRERAEAVGGTLHVQFPAAGGTRVLVELAAPSAD